MTTIYVVRHGNTFDKGDTITRVGAKTDLPLSVSGTAQAEALATHFEGLAPQGFHVAYCSPLLRTRQTAEAILSVQPGGIALETLEFLREVDYGPDENRPEEEVVARIGEEALRAWDEHAVPPPGWEIDPEQLKAAWRDLFVALGKTSSNKPVLIVTSNGIARFLLDAVTTYQTEPASIKLKTGAYGTMRVSDETVTLINWNVRP
ncbi:MAG: histidine phosphatase family protein [Henriciella sp.]